MKKKVEMVEYLRREYRRSWAEFSKFKQTHYGHEYTIEEERQYYRLRTRFTTIATACNELEIEVH